MTTIDQPGQENYADTHKIFFVVVLYKLEPGNSPAIKSLPAFCQGLQRPLVLVWSNRPENTPFLPGPMNVFSHHDPKNSGVTAAYQFAAVLAKENGCRWLMLLDEDTTLPAGGIHLYAPLMGRAELIAPLVYDQKGLLSPFRFNGVRGYRLNTMPPPWLELKRHRVINSGLLIEVAAVDSIGGFPITFPLDFSDIALQERLLTRTPLIAIAPVTIRHHFSGSTRMTYPEALHRFTSYATAGALFARETRRRLKMAWFLALRAVHLSFVYRSKGFLSVLMRDRQSLT